ncbi:Uncharacterized protein dnm_083420 [Desulfonema magnum]|uniref:Uncharacterized protein n=1 Tax=Desulfonema magnum TaxID=45655 RepID=A0A975BV10_9BACT|nr:Uncharacterized protein dnm_083420 [Desulfonema magnum]
MTADFRIDRIPQVGIGPKYPFHPLIRCHIPGPPRNPL